MDKIITVTENGLNVTENDNLLASVLCDIAKNNTAFPDIVDIYEFKKDVRLAEKDKKTGKRLRETRKAMRVYFADGSWTDVVKSNDDKDDPIVAVLYAIVKRLFGVPTEGGYVNGDGFMGKLKSYVKNARSDEKDEAAKKARIAKKEADDKKAHEEAVNRRKSNPSLGLRLKNLEDKFDTLMDALNKGSMNSNKHCHCDSKKSQNLPPRKKNGRFCRK